MTSQPRELVWFITGTSTGVGRELALAALARGDKVIASTRGSSFSKLKDLEEKGAAAVELDVTSPLDSLSETAKRAISIYGRVDVLVNNAGYALVGTLEESTPEETSHQFHTNLLGALNVTRAFLPSMREKKSGTIIWIGSISGHRSEQYLGVYSATKWAMRGISGSLNAEVSHLGLRSVCVDFGFFRTSFLTNDHRAPPVSRIPDYKPVADAVEKALTEYDGKQSGDPTKAAQALVDLAHGTGLAAGKEFPTALAFGSDAYQIIKEGYVKDLEELEKWKGMVVSTDHDA